MFDVPIAMYCFRPKIKEMNENELYLKERLQTLEKLSSVTECARGDPSQCGYWGHTPTLSESTFRYSTVDRAAAQFAV